MDPNDLRFSRDDCSAEGGHDVFAQMADQLLGFADFGTLGGRLLGRADFTEVAFQRHFQGHAFAAAALDAPAPTISPAVRRTQPSASRLLQT
ncbi:hypothetical protein [uncultured Pseudomonas sp.]|uniref:hypothetical protein n=1 Tax=uncultured Pseudomonas sp. TaxID=114707 RepID=UPI0026034889|nr:hypothetical protein [uncultured Pseudomonas sp.]